MLFITILLNLFPGLFLGIFGQGPEFLILGTGPLRIVSVAMLILCLGIIWLNTVVATGKTNVVFYIEVAGITSYLIYVWIVIEVLRLSLNVAWMSEWVYWSVMFGLSFWYLRKGDWRMIERY
jgi:Na+-driven multidrug efflux pump